MTEISVRAQRILEAMGVSTPRELHRLYLPWGATLEQHILRQPNCGRKTMKEIMEWGADGRVQAEERPPVVFLRWIMENGVWRLVGYATDEMEGPAWVRYEIATPQKDATP